VTGGRQKLVAQFFVFVHDGFDDRLSARITCDLQSSAGLWNTLVVEVSREHCTCSIGRFSNDLFPIAVKWRTRWSTGSVSGDSITETLRSLTIANSPGFVRLMARRNGFALMWLIIFSSCPWLLG